MNTDRGISLKAAVLVSGCALLAAAVRANDAEHPPPRIDSVVALPEQPHEKHDATIWYDDFDDADSLDRYPEKAGKTTADEHFGETGRSLETRYAKGSRGTGDCKVFFGDAPTYQLQAARRGETFTDVYWRIYVKHQAGWTGGGPAKLSRATSLVPPGWRQAMIAHVWSQGEALTLDPASGVRDGEVVTRKYNDFEKLRWLGNRPASKFQLHATEESGRWVCVEARARLNTPGEKDGLQQLWIDGRLESERRGLDWRGTYIGHGINAVFLEAYWNDGSPVDQSRWIDSFVIATEPIGPVVCARNPTLLRTPHSGEGEPGPWQVEVASDGAGEEIVWRSADLSDPRSVTIDTEHGTFVGARERQRDLAGDTVHFVRVRERRDADTWSAWSVWHQPLRTSR